MSKSDFGVQAKDRGAGRLSRLENLPLALVHLFAGLTQVRALAELAQP